MNFMRLLPVILSVVLLAAHFLRDGLLLLVLALLLSLLLLLVKRPFVPRFFQALLVLGGLEWIWTTFGLINERLFLGADWGRLAVIMGVVTLFTLASALVFRSSHLRERYGRASQIITSEKPNEA
ncbi:MAG: hypothetical protein ACE5FD_07830 [Anaerolineae bacterium]